MCKRGAIGIALVLALVCGTRLAAADSLLQTENDPPRTAESNVFLLGPPQETSPVVVRSRIEFKDILEINDEEETFLFSGVLTLTWNDPRQAFDPAVAGVDEKVFQGSYQFDEVSTGWYPQVVIANESGSFQASGIVLRVQPDGASTLIQTITAAAEVELNMRRFPFDRHRLKAVFEVLGFDLNEIVMEVDPGYADSLTANKVRVRKQRRSFGVCCNRGCNPRILLLRPFGCDTARRDRFAIVHGVLDGPVVSRRSHQCLIHWYSDGRRLPVVGERTDAPSLVLHLDPRLLESQFLYDVRDGWSTWLWASWIRGESASSEIGSTTAVGGYFQPYISDSSSSWLA
jgi:hypothetical protein